MKEGLIALIVLDGWGYREETEGNAVALAKTPFFDRLWAEFPHTLIHASEERVGLPAGQMGNSEGGRLNLGAGRGGVEQVFVHPIFDGRDTPPTSGLHHLRNLQEKMEQIGMGKVATVSGRYYVMDRDNRWDRVERAFRAVVRGGGKGRGE